MVRAGYPFADYADFTFHTSWLNIEKIQNSAPVKNTRFNKNTTISRAPRTADLVRYFQNFVGPGPVKCSNFSAGGETDWDRPVFNESWARTPGPVLKTNDPDPEIRKLDSD